MSSRAWRLQRGFRNGTRRSGRQLWEDENLHPARCEGLVRLCDDAESRAFPELEDRTWVTRLGHRLGVIGHVVSNSFLAVYA